MPLCIACSANLPADSAFCSACGASQAGFSNQPTTPSDHHGDLPTTPSGILLSESSTSDGRFLPGTIVAERYRVVGLLGRGGMGEVYRADDLKLGQPVALKFLPAGLESDPSRLERFLGEVRTARQVTHPNVCRVYDIGEVGGQHFISMEYVDGEDLASLLRRIGRLPEDRAVQVSRQICAGLAAAHDQGILHRDLKPANVMLDGRGRVRITDFGLAGLAESMGTDTSGTPAYMAPEQFDGTPASVRSDVYSLGLVLYELFTGTRAFQANSVAELRDMHQSSAPSSPSSLVVGLDPAIERVLLRCLETRSADRPASALAVSAALPGGDPLAAALAAGETPSPELLAESGSSEAMRLGPAIALAALAFVVFAVLGVYQGKQSLLNYLPLEKSPEVLKDRAQELIADLGYTEPVYADPAGTAWGLISWSSVIQEVAAADSSALRWEALRKRPDALTFWYRQSPQMLIPEPLPGPVLLRGAVSIMNPFPSLIGEINVAMDLSGDLRRFEAIPPRFSLQEPTEPDWTPLFEQAGLDPAAFTETPPGYSRFFAPDLKRAWVGERAELPGIVYRVEAGAYQGRPVLFNVATDASMEDLADLPEKQKVTFGMYLESAFVPSSILLVVLLALVLSRRNLARGRSDRRGALRLGSFFFFIMVISSLLGNPGLTSRIGPREVWPVMAASAFFGLFAWMGYLAIEPLGRQVWPTMFLSSSRLLSRPRVIWRDPLTGKSLLIGAVAGAILLILWPVVSQLQSMFDGEPPGLSYPNWTALHGPLAALSEVGGNTLGALLQSFLLMLSVVVGRFVTKRRWPGVLLGALLMVGMEGPGSVLSLVIAVISASAMLVVLLRWGFVAATMAFAVQSLAWLVRVPSLTSWYSDAAVMTYLLIAGLLAYGVWAATGRSERI